MQQGNIAVQTENIFPIIKKFLYSDHEIFLRELVSNGVDATTKLLAFAQKGENVGDISDLALEIKIDKDAKTLTICDKGIGMTAEEVNKYLNQIAFSSAEEFLNKFKNESIIGHFGLGFYSAFMVADKVEVVTKSYKQADGGVTWICDGNPTYTLLENDKATRGTDIILYINEESKEFLDEQRVSSLLNKYCKFLPYPIKFGVKTETTYEGEGEDAKEIKTEVDNIINNTEPAWKKQPSDLTDEEYKNFYQELYPYSPEPLFWIHLNIDYPFNLTGILYFPKFKQSLEVQKNKIQLYSNQVFVTDDVKEIVPEFMTLLQGVIDSPDIPLNVSRSYLQSDGNVKKITGYINKKVSEKLTELFKKDRQDFEKKWEDIGIFVKYGMIADEKFNERTEAIALLTDLDNKHHTVEEYIEKVKPLQTDKHDKVVLLYTNNSNEHNSFIASANNRGYNVLQMDEMIDNHFMQHLEYKKGNITFVRVDSDTADNIIQKEDTPETVLNETEQKTVQTIFEGIAQVGGQVQLKPLSPDDQPVIITRPEFMRRMKEMQQMQGMKLDGFPDMYNVVINTNHPLIVQKLLQQTNDLEQKDFANYLYNLALLNQNMLKGADLTAFIQKSLVMIS
ncbi:MAG: molecular chaperone HtpG [Saprospiraceae bacterium]|nr:molecular chaperone HtpG [Saprospiraceae bacterium]